jgi:hypothetical protein
LSEKEERKRIVKFMQMMPKCECGRRTKVTPRAQAGVTWAAGMVDATGMGLAGGAQLVDHAVGGGQLQLDQIRVEIVGVGTGLLCKNWGYANFAKFWIMPNLMSLKINKFKGILVLKQNL